MLVLSSSTCSSANAADNLANDLKPYIPQQHTVQIIQLVEATLPPPPSRTYDYDYDYSDSYSSSPASSSSSPSSSSSSSSSSYCSSVDQEDASSLNSLSTETYSITKRILAWRQDFDVHLAASPSSSSSSSSPSSVSSSLKRKININDDDDDHLQDDNISHTRSSKRSRSVHSLGMHSCTACDASFMTRQCLKLHGSDNKAKEACCVAVEYAFE